MIDLVDSGAVPLRLPLGSDTYDDVRAALVARLADHDAHRDVAFSVVKDELKKVRPVPPALRGIRSGRVRRAQRAG